MGYGLVFNASPWPTKARLALQGTAVSFDVFLRVVFVFFPKTKAFDQNCTQLIRSEAQVENFKRLLP